ncbi:rod shape-determining protein RodA [Ornithinibacillus massiliensis]|uniref:Rod shape-determining protein RodA n=1 Tax=Ornithinibacillus massiliensis TaxID=1944633 RepID=A0ABS5MDN8_9BACI|nr:FtsW/RodA/SpoVE family cell cycle protein [Ornithinibacillus massiliensis]MBS3680439.1 rod shape-determining protein RodA [Ornithinibacillus massiliensis]
MNTNKNNIDYTLISIILLLGIVSVFTIYTVEPTLPATLADQNFFQKQIIWYVGGGLIIALLMQIDYDRFRQLTWILYGIGMVMLLMLFFGFPPGIVHEVNNAVSWFKFPVLGTLQPAEFMKVILILTLAHVMYFHNQKYIKPTVKNDLWLLCKILLLSLPPMGLIAVQPDLGGLLVLAAITGAMILVSGIRWSLILSIILIALGGIGLIVAAYFLFPDSIAVFLEETVFKHVSSRFYGWLSPEQYSESGYQLIRAMMAIGSGQLFGKGIEVMQVSVPERHTDMIFTAIAEQFGFIGSSIVVTLFFLLLYRLIYIAIQSNDSYASYIVTGTVGMFAYQIFQNIGMSIQLLPITGLPLPFLSYGGSSTLTYLLAIGIVLNIHSRTKKYMFE